MTNHHPTVAARNYFFVLSAASLLFSSLLFARPKHVLHPDTYAPEWYVADDTGPDGKDKIPINAGAAATTGTVAAYAGKDTVIFHNQTRPDTAFLVGTATGTASSFRWTKISGPAGERIVHASAASTRVLNLTIGSYLFKLTVNGTAADTVAVHVRNWQQKNVSKCRPGGGKAFVLPVSSPGKYNRPYINRDKVLSEPLMGGDTLYLQGGTYSAVELGDFGGAPGCPVYIMPKDAPVVIKNNAYFRIAIRDSNLVQHAVVDGTTLRSKDMAYGFVMDNSELAPADVRVQSLTANWLADFTIKGFMSINSGVMQIKMDAKEKPFGRYDKFILRNITIEDCFINGGTGEGMYIGHTAPGGGQGGNKYGPPPRMERVIIRNNIVVNTAWDGIQLSNARGNCIISGNLVYKAGTRKQASQQAGIIMGGNTSGRVDSNIIINTTGNAIQNFGYGKITNSWNVVDSVYSGKGNQDGFYQSSHAAAPEVNTPLNIYNYHNLVSRTERAFIRVANNSGVMTPGAITGNYLIHPTAKSLSGLIVSNASDRIDGNKIIAKFSFSVGKIGVAKTGVQFYMTQGSATKSFATPKDAVVWLFGRLTGSPPAANKLPLANAGKDQAITMPASSITLQGTAQDSDGTIASYKWTKISGPSQYSIAAPQSSTTKIQQLAPGTYGFELAVIDNAGATGRDTVAIVVAPAVNTAPAVFAGNDARVKLPINAVALSGTASDAQANIATYKWRKLSGPAGYLLVDAAKLSAKVQNLVQGVYQFELSVTDSLAMAGKDTITITVDAAGTTVPVSFAYRINGGGATVSTSYGTFEADRGFGPATTRTYENKTAIGATADDVLYQTERFGKRFDYKLPVPDGNYKVKLHWAEIYYAASGKRVFDVTLEGKKVLDNYDIVKRAGVKNAVVEQFVVNVLDDTLNIDFSSLASDGGTDYAKISAIEVLSEQAVVPQTLKPNNIAPFADAGPTVQNVLPQSAVLLKGAGYDSDGIIARYAWRSLNTRGRIFIQNPDAAATFVSGMDEGINKFELKVVDNKGAWACDTVAVRVHADKTNFVAVSPTVTQGMVAVRYATTPLLAPELKVFNGNGILMLKQSMPAGSRSSSIYIDLSALPPGMYYIEVPVAAGVSVTKKVIRQ